MDDLRKNKMPHLVLAAAAIVLSLVFHGALMFAADRLLFRLSLVVGEDFNLPLRRSFSILAVKPVAAARIGPAGTESFRPWAGSARAITGDRLVPPDIEALRPLLDKDRILERSVKIPDKFKPQDSAGEWFPREEMIKIEKKFLSDEAVPLPRRLIPAIDRLRDVPDVLLPVQRTEIALGNLNAGRLDSGAGIGADFGPAGKPGKGGPDIMNMADAGVKDADPARGGLDMGESTASVPDPDLVEKPAQTSARKAIEDLLKARMEVYLPIFERKYGYFRISISRAGEELLPVLPKDIILLQDCSASMAEQRLMICREGLKKALAHIGAGDRFNIICFSESVKKWSEEWTAPDNDSLKGAAGFIDKMNFGGNTDIYSSLEELFKLPRVRGRPVVAVLVSDGQPTAGKTAGAEVIGEFSRKNDGAVSVFTLATSATVNSYLLELLSYCNRGDYRAVRTGRWGIPEEMDLLMKETARPVLSDVRFNFSGREMEVYPMLSGNLYRDKELVLYGRFTRRMEKIVFQAVGNTEQKECDMIFSMDVGEAERSGGDEIRHEWAKQKVYSLMGLYARDRNAELLKALDETSRDYKVKIPYKQGI